MKRKFQTNAKHNKRNMCVSAVRTYAEERGWRERYMRMFRNYEFDETYHSLWA